jgi:hypothetical protein
MNLDTPLTNDGDDDDTDEVPFVPPNDELFEAQQKHQLGERKKLFDDLTAYLPNPNPVTLDNIRMRWESGFLNLIHVGPWKSIWDLLHAAELAPGFCTSGTVFFGYGQGGQQAMDLSQSAKHEKLIVDMARYGIHAYTLELAAKIDAAGRKGNQARFDELALLFMEWIKANPEEYRLLEIQGEVFKYLEDFECAALPCAKGFVADTLPNIHNALSKLANRVFIFAQVPGDTAAGWRGFFAFARGYSRLPDSIIKQFEKYRFECHVTDS